MAPPSTFFLPPRGVASLGLSLASLCRQAGVAPSQALSTDDFFRVWNAADDAIADRSAGLRFGSGGIASGYGVAGIVSLHAPDFRKALAALSRYKRLTCPEAVEVQVGDGEAAVSYRWLQATGDVPRLLVDTVMASLLELARQGTAGLVAPIRLELARRPSDAELLRRHFGCPIVFGAAHDAMVFASAALDKPFVTADGGAFARVLHNLETLLTAAAGPSALAGEVRVAIARQLSDGRQPNIAGVAGRLGLSGRTLQRRLADGGMSFQEQLASVRHTTATRLLAHTDLDPVAIALLLGFIEPNSFARAFRGWERTSPVRWRLLRTIQPPTKAA